MDTWLSGFAAGRPLLQHLGAAAALFEGGDWPAPERVQQAIAGRDLRTAAGLPLRLVPAGSGDSAMPYEMRLYAQGELEFRERNWHDLFNVLVWLTFPRAKAALNARHHAALSAAGAGGSRGPVRDALTLFDESGVVVLSADAALLRMIREFDWKTLFWTHRAAVVAGMCFPLFGHALCEKALSPYRGITGRALLLEVAPVFFEWQTEAQLAWMDDAVARRIADPQSLLSTRELAPLPVLGIPGGCAENGRPEYYDDRDHFRSGRRRDDRFADAKGGA